MSGLEGGLVSAVAYTLYNVLYTYAWLETAVTLTFTPQQYMYNCICVCNTHIFPELRSPIQDLLHYI